MNVQFARSQPGSPFIPQANKENLASNLSLDAPNGGSETLSHVVSALEANANTNANGA